MFQIRVLFQPVALSLALLCALSFVQPGTAWSAEAEGDEAVDEKPVPLPPANGKARLKAVDPEYNFGFVSSNYVKPITHTFVFRNIGKEKLVIHRIKSSCGCTSAILSASDIVPGATASIVATLDNKPGEEKVTISVRSNDPTNATQVLQMNGTILSAWRYVPTQLDMGAIGKKETVTKDVSVTSQYLKEDPQYRITSVTAKCPDIQAATMEAPIEEKKQGKLPYKEIQRMVRVNVTANTTVGEQSHPVLISTDDPKNPTQTITVHWTVEGDLSVIPKKVFPSEIKGSKKTKDLEISSRSGQPFEVTSIVVQGDKGGEDVEVTLKPSSTPSKKVYTVSPRIETDSTSGSRSGKIVFKTSNPEQPEVTVLYVASFRK